MRTSIAQTISSRPITSPPCRTWRNCAPSASTHCSFSGTDVVGVASARKPERTRQVLTRLRGMDRATWRLIGWAVVVGAVVAALVMMSVAVLLLLGNSEQARQQRDAQARTLRVLVECTTPPSLRT